VAWVVRVDNQNKRHILINLLAHVDGYKISADFLSVVNLMDAKFHQLKLQIRTERTART